MIFTLTDVAVAYRKAKVDLYLSSKPSLLQILQYEEDLEGNLQLLLLALNGESEEWVIDEDFLGGYTFIPKSVDILQQPEAFAPIQFSDPAKRWATLRESAVAGSAKERPNAEFRQASECSMNFHVLSTLWLLKVGEKYDAKLSGSACGNRLRRRKDNRVNELSLGSFVPYHEPFRRWRDDGLKTMNSALSDGKKIVALTADVTSFYHQLDPAFMLDEAYLAMLNLSLDDSERKLNRLFVSALLAWSARSALGRGLPVGLPASAVVANMALVELDRVIEQEVVPLYYARYVDDIMLVMQDGSSFSTAKQVWQWLFNRSNGHLAWDDDGVSQNLNVTFTSKYLSTSEIIFSNKKNKIFLLEGDSGRAMVASIARHVHERASEWRSLPVLPQSATGVATDMVAATQLDGELADNLRKADSLTMRRANFALKLRSFEAYERDLRPEDWESHRTAFYKAFIEHVLVLPYFFDLASYVPRVVKLATACADFERLGAILAAIERVAAEICDNCDVSVKADGNRVVATEDVLGRWRKTFEESIGDSIVAAFPPLLNATEETSWKAHIAGREGWVYARDWEVSRVHEMHRRLFDHDLAHTPRRFGSLPPELIFPKALKLENCVTLKGVEHLLGPQVEEGLAVLGGWLNWRVGQVPLGVAFATRPFNLAEIYLLAENPFDDVLQEDLNAVILALRGFPITGKMPQYVMDSSAPGGKVLMIDGRKAPNRKRIALASWKTSHDSWTASVMRAPDPDRGRYQRLIGLINQIISSPERIDYLVFPELSIPARWFVRIAQKLHSRGISLISGIEYQHMEHGEVTNQIWGSYDHVGLGFSSMMVFRQDKQRPALGEEHELHSLAGISLKPRELWDSPPIIKHGDFVFSMLVCSELTNIGYRAGLGGHVDALFVPEWNRDIHTFDSLVESAALDIHAYIIQCNDREFGDSRIRAPYKDSWRRDVIRVKGGLSDYVVIGEIDVLALRKFQSNHRSPSEPFKPVPDGFVINKMRMALPVKGEKPAADAPGAQQEVLGWIST